MIIYVYSCFVLEFTREGSESAWLSPNQSEYVEPSNKKHRHGLAKKIKMHFKKSKKEKKGDSMDLAASFDPGSLNVATFRRLAAEPYKRSLTPPVLPYHGNSRMPHSISCNISSQDTSSHSNPASTSTSPLLLRRMVNGSHGDHSPSLDTKESPTLDTHPPSVLVHQSSFEEEEEEGGQQTPVPQGGEPGLGEPSLIKMEDKVSANMIACHNVNIHFCMCSLSRIHT